VKTRQQRLKKKNAYQELVGELTNSISTLPGKPSLIDGLEEQRKVFFRIGEINRTNKEYHRKKTYS
jgi:hypothetical protein